jgi:CrcB protein
VFGLTGKLLAIAGAGAAGALLRFGLSNGVYRVLGREFPFGTMVVNVLGSLLIGYFFVLFLERTIVSEALRSAILIGLLGSFTTFSTFSLETLNLFNEGAYVKAVMNVVLSVALCLAATWTGFTMARQM